MLTTPPPSWASWQRIANAVEVRDAPRRPPIPVVARVIWERDGEEQLSGSAVAWTRDAVLVDIDDPRCATSGAWLAAGDVRRRDQRPTLTREYAVDRLPVDAPAAAIERALNDRAAVGWELVELSFAAGLVAVYSRAVGKRQ